MHGRTKHKPIGVFCYIEKLIDPIRKYATPKFLALLTINTARQWLDPDLEYFGFNPFYIQRFGHFLQCRIGAALGMGASIYQ